MGKLINYLTILVCVDILLIITGISGKTTISGILFNTILDLQNFNTSSFWLNLVGDIANLTSSPSGFLQFGAALTAVAVGVIFRNSDTLLFIPIALALAGLAADFTGLMTYLYSLNEILAVIIMAPILITYILTLLEWLRGKD